MTTELAYAGPVPAPAGPPARTLELVTAPCEPDEMLEALAGSSVSPEWLARIAGADISAVRRAVERGDLVGLRPDGARDTLIPLWQLGEDGRPLPGLHAVLYEADRAGLTPFELHKLMSRRAGLTGDRRLADALREGRAEYVREAIRASA